MSQPNDQYSVLTPPFLAPAVDISSDGSQVSLSPVWKRHLTAVASKAGRSMVWRGAWQSGTRYAINDVVSDGEPVSLWCALAQNANQQPGTDGNIWSLVLAGGGGTSTPIATSTTVGTVKPDNTTITIDGAGTITSIGGVTLPIAESDVTNLTTDLGLKAPLASPTFTGDPKAPTATPGDNDTSIATTAFVTAAVAASAVTLPIAESNVTNLTTDLAAKAPLASPTFTGDPKAPTPTVGDNDTSIATTAFVTAAVSASAITLPIAESDVTNLVSDLALKAPLASPALTGTPTAPTAVAGTSTTQIATTAFVESEIGPGGGGAYFAWGGDGSDSSVVFDGAATVLGVAPSSSIYVMTRDICCTDITVDTGVTIKTANYAIFATGTVTVNGTIHNDGQTGGNGGNAASATGGNGGNQGVRTSNVGGSATHYGVFINPVAGTAGGNGGTAAGTQAGAANPGGSVGNTPMDGTGVAGSTGSSGGKGGTGTSGAGGAARTGGGGGGVFLSTGWQIGRVASIAVTGIAFNGTTPHVVQPSNAAHGGAPGGSGGGGDTTNAGGGGGGGGGEGGSAGVVAIFAHTITIGASGIVRANGGTGGNGGNGRKQAVGNVGGGGGGAGGSGGVGGIVWLIYHRYTNAGTVQALGGTHGPGGTKGLPNGTGTDNAANGADGLDGQAGNVVLIPC